MSDFIRSISYAAGFYGSDFESLIDFAAEHEVPAVQLIPDQFPNLYSELDPGRIDSIRKRLNQENIKASVHNVFYDINICSLVPEVQEFSLQVTEKVARLASELDARLVTVHPGYMYPGWRNDPGQNSRFWDSAKRAIENLDRIGSQYSTSFLLENGSYCLSLRLSESRQDFHLGIDIGELNTLVEFGGSNISICMDYGKLLASGVSPREFCKTFLNRIHQVQISTAHQIEDTISLLRNSPVAEIEVVFEGKQRSELLAFTTAINPRNK